MSSRDPKWEGVQGGITAEGNTLVIELEIQPEQITGYRVYLPVSLRDALPLVLAKMVRRIDEALHA